MEYLAIATLLWCVLIVSTAVNFPLFSYCNKGVTGNARSCSQVLIFSQRVWFYCARENFGA